MTSNIPATTWTWMVNSPPEITGAQGNNTGTLSSIRQTLSNSSKIAQNVIYTITPRVYGRCDLPSIPSDVWVNPAPEILATATDTLICTGEATTITVSNPNTSVRGTWMYDLTVTPDQGIGGNRSNGTFSDPTSFTETLTNSHTKLRKIVYRFTPRIAYNNDGSSCSGQAKIITIWVRPEIRYTREISDFNGYNVSCYGKSDGFIRLTPSAESGPLTFRWSGPSGFNSSKKDISGLVAGQYTVIMTDKNNCTVSETISMIEAKRFSMTINAARSEDRAYNINCAGQNTGSITISPVNGVGLINYMWSDRGSGSIRNDLAAGKYRIILLDANNCPADSSVTLTQPEMISVAFDITSPLCPEKPDGAIKANVTGGIPGNGYTYLWSDNTTTGNILSNIKQGSYYVAVSDINGCKVKANADVEAYNEFCLIIPNIFTPNNDLTNDTWMIDNINLYPNMEITIYNRWGQFVWKSEKGYSIPWDGRSNGVDLPMDGYHYTIDLHNGYKIISGAVTIVR